MWFETNINQVMPCYMLQVQTIDPPEILSNLKVEAELIKWI